VTTKVVVEADFAELPDAYKPTSMSLVTNHAPTTLGMKALGLLVHPSLFYTRSSLSRMSFATIRHIANESFAV
jgi:hypothetical protein